MTTQAAMLLLGMAVTEAESVPEVLIVYAQDQFGQTQQLGEALAKGAKSTGAAARALPVVAANYERDVVSADAIILGSGVYNGNAAPELLSFVNSFDFADDMSSKVGSAFSTGAASAGGLQPVMESLIRGLMTFRMVVVGGDSWTSSEGTGAVTNANNSIAAEDLAAARAQGERVARLAHALRRSRASPPPPPTIENVQPPTWGTSWSASISANLTQVGYDAGLVLVNFSTHCGDDATKQKMKTVYGDFYTVLTRCDLGIEFTIAPASRGGSCSHRTVGSDVDGRVCQACGCPFCTRDTNGTYTHGELVGSRTATIWAPKERRIDTLTGKLLDVWQGRAVSSDGSGEGYALKTAIAFATDGITPVAVNVSHPLWVQTTARIAAFSRLVPDSAFDIPDACLTKLEPSQVMQTS